MMTHAHMYGPYALGTGNCPELKKPVCATPRQRHLQKKSTDSCRGLCQASTVAFVGTFSHIRVGSLTDFPRLRKGSCGFRACSFGGRHASSVVTLKKESRRTIEAEDHCCDTPAAALEDCIKVPKPRPLAMGPKHFGRFNLSCLVLCGLLLHQGECGGHQLGLRSRSVASLTSVPNCCALSLLQF
jgi:hypothetical protein